MNDLSIRQNEIVTLARSSGRVAVDDLARRYDVSPQTIRKDLNELCDRQLLTPRAWWGDYRLRHREHRV